MSRRNQVRAAIVVVALILLAIPIVSIVNTLSQRSELRARCESAGGVMVRVSGSRYNNHRVCIDRSVVIDLGEKP